MVETYRNKFNKKYGFEPNASHSIVEIAKLTGYAKKGLEMIQSRGEGAFFSNHQSVRPNITSPQAWGRARIYSAVTKGSKASRVDKSFLIKK